MGRCDTRIRFAHFEADLRSGELFRQGIKIPLQDKPFRILALLLRRAPRQVTREEIYGKVWGDTHVEKRLSLNTALRKLRIALADDAKNPTLIATTEKGYRLLAEPQPALPRRAPSRTASLRVAVAPFVNVGAEGEEYFADGLTEQMISLLGHTQRQISIIAPFSTLQYKRSGKALPEIGREFNADYALGGTVALKRRTVKITAMLIHTRDQAIVWADSYSRPRGDIFDIQDDITNRIARSIVTVLTAPEISARRFKTSPIAYEKYLRGCFFASKWTAEGFRKAIDLFQEAIKADPNFAPAHGSLAKVYMGMSAQGVLPPDVINNLTVTEASEALRLCPDLADAHTALGWSRMLYDADWAGSEASFLRAIELNPSSNTAYEGYAHLLTVLARHEEAIEASSRACSLDPLSPFAANVLACNYYFSRQYDKALERWLRNLEMDAGFSIGHSCLGWVYEALGQYQKAVAAQRMAVKHNAMSPAIRASLARALALNGETDEARSVLKDVLAARETMWIAPYWTAVVYLALGEHATALEWLTEEVEARDGWRVFFAVNPMLDGLRSYPEFTELMRRVGLPLVPEKRAVGAARS